MPTQQFPTPCPFQTPFPPGDPGLSGTLSAEVTDPGHAPTTIISIADAFEVCVRWKLEGSLARLICGEWCVCVFFESLGPCDDFQAVTPCPHFEIVNCNDEEYEECFTIPAGTVQAAQCSCPYQVIVTLTIFDDCGRPAPIAAHCMGPVLQFYTPGP